MFAQEPQQKLQQERVRARQARALQVRAQPARARQARVLQAPAQPVQPPEVASQPRGAVAPQISAVLEHIVGATRHAAELRNMLLDATAPRQAERHSTC